MPRRRKISEDIETYSDDEYVVTTKYSDGSTVIEFKEYEEAEGPGYYNEFDGPEYDYLRDD